MLFRFLKALFGTNKPRKTSVKGYPRKQAVKAREAPFPTSKVPTVEARTPEETVLKGPCYVVDGDTIRIDKKTIRLSGIDAPELHHPWDKFSDGKYSHLEPSGVRKKLWRCAAKHKGKFFETPKNGG